MSTPRLKLKLQLDDNDSLIGPGKIALLKAIQKEHSYREPRSPSTCRTVKLGF